MGTVAIRELGMLRGFRGMGANLTSQTAAQIVSAGIAATTASLSILTALASGGSLAGPIGAAVAAASAVAIALYNVFKGCGQTCTITSNLANQTEPILLQNLQNYLSVSPRYASFQAAHLNNFDTAWAALTAACSNPSYQAAGQRCITDRQRGACTWRTSTPGQWQAGQWIPPGPQVSSGGTCWNWFVGYRDPIANDPYVVPDPVSLPGGGALSIASPTGSTSLVPLLIIAAIAAGVLLL
jgi:hypothetical protein